MKLRIVLSYFNQAISLTLLIIIGCIFTSCSDINAPSDNNKEVGNKILENSIDNKHVKFSELEIVRKAERSLIDLSQHIPGFGGHYLDRDGNLIVLAKDISFPQNIKQSVLSYTKTRPQLKDLNIEQIKLEIAKYSYSELSEWRDILMRPIFQSGQITKLDLAEHINRITIGVEDASKIEEVESILLNTIVPRNAINIEITGKIVHLSEYKTHVVKNNIMLTQTLKDKFRPVTGGIEIFTNALELCTMSFAALWNSQMTFLTASHCSDNHWSLDSGTDFYQPTWSNSIVIGQEIYDPSGWDCGFLFHNPECRASDAAVIDLVSSETGDVGTIAKTTGRGVGWSQGSITIDQNLPRFRVISDDKEIMYNMPVNKMGKNSGWTHGYISETCSNIPWGNKQNGVALCQTIVDGMYAESGDSGSPVFYDHTTPFGDVEMLGILWGLYTQEEQVVFSAMENVKYDLGSM